MDDSDRPPPPEFLTVAQVADELGVSRPYIQRLVNSGELPATRNHHGRGKPWIIARLMLETWIRRQYEQTDAWREANPRGGDVMWDRDTGGHR